MLKSIVSCVYISDHTLRFHLVFCLQYYYFYGPDGKLYKGKVDPRYDSMVDPIEDPKNGASNHIDGEDID